MRRLNERQDYGLSAWMKRLVEDGPLPDSWIVHLFLAKLFAVGPDVEFRHELREDFETLFGDE